MFRIKNLVKIANCQIRTLKENNGKNDPKTKRTRMHITNGGMFTCDEGRLWPGGTKHPDSSGHVSFITTWKPIIYFPRSKTNLHAYFFIEVFLEPILR